uniref:Uncharacterized protein n=1 Tax=Aegilops tauschii subsp. strangulata TaxID=200361 RepID=A0A453T1X6_AEGTS
LWIPSFQSRFSRFLLLRSPLPPPGLPKSGALPSPSPRVSPPRSPRLRPAPPIPSPPTHRLPIALPSSRCEGASAGIGRSLLPRRLQLDLLPGPPGASRGRRAPWSPHRAASAVVGEQSVPSVLGADWGPGYSQIRSPCAGVHWSRD